MTERVVPRRPGEWEDLNSYLIYLRHLAAYHFLNSMIKGRRILDLGCGTGYGTVHIATNHDVQVIGIDIALDALYSITDHTNNLTFIAGDSLRLPFSAETFDIVVSFQVIEHIWDEIGYLAEVKRVLAHGGMFIVSTPNKALRLLPFQPPFNPYHVREYNHHSLQKALTRQFDNVKIQGLHATSEIMAIEYKRLKQNPIEVYARLIRQRLPIPSLIIKRAKNLFSYSRKQSKDIPNNVTLTPFSENNYSINDFWVDSNHIDTALDLIGICYKQ